MKEVFKNPSHAAQWTRAAEGEPVDFRQLLDGCGYKACTDWPPASFYKQLMEVYPDAKVILSVRDPDKWYESSKETIWQGRQALGQLPWYAAAAAKLLTPGRSRTMQMINKLIWEGDLQAVPAEKLLVFEVKQGWEPICKFLGKPVPQQPFPHVNDREEWRSMLQSARRANARLAYGVPAVAAVLAAAGVTVGRVLLQRARRS